MTSLGEFATRCKTVVSLGAHCETVEQIVSYFGRATATPFDWMITPIDSVIKIIEDDGERLGTNFVTGWQGKTIQCNIYGCVYYHEFERTADGSCIFDVAALNECAQKMRHKMQKLTALYTGEESVLFVRAHGRSDAIGDRLGGDVTKSSDLNALVDVIAAKAPNLDFRMLFVHAEGRDGEAFDLTGDLSPAIIVRKVQNPASFGWQGDFASWGEAFASIGFERGFGK